MTGCRYVYVCAFLLLGLPVCTDGQISKHHSFLHAAQVHYICNGQRAHKRALQMFRHQECDFETQFGLGVVEL